MRTCILFDAYELSTTISHIAWGTRRMIAQSNLLADAPVIFQPVVTDWIIPVLLLGVSATGRKLVRKEGGWQWDDAFVGPDLCLAAVSAGLLKIFDLLKHLPVPADKLEGFEYEAGMAVLLIIVTFCVYTFVLSEHRDLALAGSSGKFRRCRLGLLCNGIGFACLTAFLILIKPL